MTIRSEVRDTRDGVGRLQRRYLVPDSGEGAELRAFIEAALGIPPNATRFSVTFEARKPVQVSVDYYPQINQEDAP